MGFDNERLTRILLNTDDARVWAEQFCLQFHDRIINALSDEEDVDPELMFTWFANAMQTGINLYELRRLGAQEELQNVFKEDNNEPTT